MRLRGFEPLATRRNEASESSASRIAEMLAPLSSSLRLADEFRAFSGVEPATASGARLISLQTSTIWNMRHNPRKPLGDRQDVSLQLRRLTSNLRGDVMFTSWPVRCGLPRSRGRALPRRPWR
jgi:hypothetical protein